METLILIEMDQKMLKLKKLIENFWKIAWGDLKKMFY